MSKKPEKQDFEFESEFDVSKIKESAELEIKPKFELDDTGIEFAKNIQIVGTYYNIDLPESKQINKKTVKAIDFLYNDVVHSFIAESESFRYQLDVIRYKNKLSLNELNGLKLKIWKELRTLNTPKFKGKAEVYCLKQL